MPESKTKAPPLTEEAHSHASKIVDKFDSDLKQISEKIAENGVAEVVLVPHVNEALLTLKRAGLQKHQKPKFFMRPDFWVGTGTLLVGLAPTISSFSKDIIESNGQSATSQPLLMWPWMIVVPFVVFGVGMFMAGCGWRSGGKESI